MTAPRAIESQHTLRTAVARFEELRTRESLAGSATDRSPDVAGAERLSPEEMLELLTLGEVIARKVRYGRQLTIRDARAAGASWSTIGRALDMTKQAAWEAHTRWLDEQAAAHRGSDLEGLDDGDITRARAAAGSPDDDVRP
jgi:hypothetical protein